MTRALLAIILVAAPAFADEMEGDVVYLPMVGGESLTVDNPMGAVRLRGWDEPVIRIMATKRAATGGAARIHQLKVKVDIRGGQVRIGAGVRFSDEQWLPLPQKDAGIDLVIDAPRGMAVAANTFNGNIDAANFRGGAQLASENGTIRATDISGKVNTQSRDGRQSLQAIHGPLVSNVRAVGDVELEAVDGSTIDATVHRGSITAREVTSPMVRLSAVVGAIVFVGAVRAGGRYELTTYEGDVRLLLRPAPFTLVARAPNGVQSAFPLRGGKTTKELLEGEFQGGGASLELISHKGSISLARQ